MKYGSLRNKAIIEWFEKENTDVKMSVFVTQSKCGKTSAESGLLSKEKSVAKSNLVFASFWP